jgi:rhodanese-related sulfurtransferase
VAANEYAGDIDCLEAWQVLATVAGAQLIDVRTRAEWSFVGLPDLSALGLGPLLVEWQFFPSGERNPDFITEVDAALSEAGAPPDAPLLLLCRSGGRSAAAAAALTQAGFGPAYNIIGGFEGELDASRHRGLRGGWKAAGLAWQQG